MPRCNTPPHDNSIPAGDGGFGEIEEIYDFGDEDDFLPLEDDLETDDVVPENEEIEQATAVEEEEEEGDEAQTNPIVYSSHKGSVFCCALSPTADVGASGGEDDMAYIWDIDSGSTLFECSGHKDSVSSLGFSHEGTYLATGDMGGYIQVWKVSTKTRIWEFETEDLNWMIWHPSSNILFAGTTIGEVWMWLIPKGNSKSLAYAGVSAECGALTRDGKRLCVGYMDGSIRVLDLKSGQTLHTFQSHEHQVTSISTHMDNSLVLSGSTDATGKIFNTSTGKELVTLSGWASAFPGTPSGEDYDHSIEVVSFCPSNTNLAVTATLSGVIMIWDISSRTSRHNIIQGCGTSQVVWHPTLPYFLTAGLDGTLRVYDVRSAEQLFQFKGHKSTILSCDIKSDGSKVVSSSDDGIVRILTTADLWASN